MKNNILIYIVLISAIISGCNENENVASFKVEAEVSSAFAIAGDEVKFTCTFSNDDILPEKISWFTSDGKWQSNNSDSSDTALRSLEVNNTLLLEGEPKNYVVTACFDIGKKRNCKSTELSTSTHFPGDLIIVSDINPITDSTETVNLSVYPKLNGSSFSGGIYIFPEVRFEHYSGVTENVGVFLPPQKELKETALSMPILFEYKINDLGVIEGSTDSMYVRFRMVGMDGLERDGGEVLIRVRK